MCDSTSWAGRSDARNEITEELARRVERDKEFGRGRGTLGRTRSHRGESRRSRTREGSDRVRERDREERKKAQLLTTTKVPLFLACCLFFSAIAVTGQEFWESFTLPREYLVVSVLMASTFPHRFRDTHCIVRLRIFHPEHVQQCVTSIWADWIADPSFVNLEARQGKHSDSLTVPFRAQMYSCQSRAREQRTWFLFLSSSRMWQSIRKPQQQNVLESDCGHTLRRGRT